MALPLGKVARYDITIYYTIHERKKTSLVFDYYVYYHTSQKFKVQIKSHWKMAQKYSYNHHSFSFLVNLVQYLILFSFQLLYICFNDLWSIHLAVTLTVQCSISSFRDYPLLHLVFLKAI